MSFRIGSNMAYGTVDVDAAAEEIVPARTIRKSVTIQNAEPSTNILYIGSNSSVTASNGLRLGPLASITLDDYSGPIYAIADTADTDVRYIEIY